MILYVETSHEGSLCSDFYSKPDELRIIAENAFQGKTFDLILIDAPLGADMKQYSRIAVLESLPECLAEQFVIMIDDTDRSGEKNG